MADTKSKTKSKSSDSTTTASATASPKTRARNTDRSEARSRRMTGSRRKKEGDTDYLFLPPVVGRRSEGGRFLGKKFDERYEVTVWKLDGNWYRGSADARTLDKAEVVFVGGHVYDITDEMAQELIGAGFTDGTQDEDGNFGSPTDSRHFLDKNFDDEDEKV